MSTTHISHAPQAVGLNARRILAVLIGLGALALILAVVLLSNGGTSTKPIPAGRAYFPPPGEAAKAAAIRHSRDAAVPPGSGVRLGRVPGRQPHRLPN